MKQVPKKGYSRWLGLLSFLVILHPSFYLMIQTNALYIPLIFIFAVCFCRFFSKKYYLLDGIGPLWLWVPCALYAFVTCLISGGRLPLSCLTMLIFAILMCIRADQTDWIRPCLVTVVITMLFYGLSTILFYVFPAAYTPVKATLFPNVLEATDYRSGLTTHYSFNGTYISIGLLCSTTLCLFDTGKRKKKIWTVFAIAMIFALILTTKRAHILSCFVAIALTYLLTNRKGKGQRLVAGLALLIFVLQMASAFSPGISESMERLLGTVGHEDTDGNLLTRYVLWQYALSAFSQHPLFGQGWGTFVYHWANGETTLIAHNELLNLLAEQGSFGAIIFSGMAVYSMIDSARLAMKCKDDDLRTYLLGSFCIQLFSVVYGYSSGTLFSYEINFVPYFIALCILASCKYSIKQNQPVKVTCATDNGNMRDAYES